MAWPEHGHILAPLALARRLRARGDCAIFAGAPQIEAPVREAGFDFCDLTRIPDTANSKPLSSIFSIMPGRWALRQAIDHLVSAFSVVTQCHRPDLILLDSLYAPLAILVAGFKIPWAQYETDLPRELDPCVPPPGCMVVPARCSGSDTRVRAAWAMALCDARRARRRSKKLPVGYAWSMASYFPDALIAHLEERFGKQVDFNRSTVYPPVAQGPRMVFCPRAFDFARSRAENVSWVGPCIDECRPEPDFPWHSLPSDLPLAYCSFGSQSMRNRRAPALLQRVVEVFSKRSDFFLVVACPPAHIGGLNADPRRVLVVPFSPQLRLLRRAALSITHAGFNSVKEAASSGVPMIALPLSHDQPRNAALIEYQRIGIALDPNQMTALDLDQAIARVCDSAEIRENCSRMKQEFARSATEGLDLAWVDGLLGLSVDSP